MTAKCDIDLLPDSIRARSRAHVRTGRYAVAALVAFTFAIIVVTWSRLSAEHARHEMRDAEAHAAEVLALEARATGLRGALETRRAAIERYHHMELPVRMSSVLSTVINQLPESVGLDEIGVEAGYRRAVRTPRSTGGTTGEEQRRLLTIELTGFAVSDAEVAELVDRLAAQRPFQEVNLDFSRSRTVRDQPARAFRLSFKVDLEPRYEITLRDFESDAVSAVAVEAGDGVQ
jgi:hypothetical protein